jgi:hypothetical protein
MRYPPEKYFQSIFEGVTANEINVFVAFLLDAEKQEELIIANDY